MSLESAHLKIPTILIKMNKNQNVDGRGMESIGHYLTCNKSDLKNYSRFTDLIIMLLKNYKRFKKLSSNPEIKNINNTKKLTKAIYKLIN